MDELQIRLECLRLAHDSRCSPKEVADRARQYSDYVSGQNDHALREGIRNLAAVS